MIDKRLKFIDNTKYVWECLACSRRVISETQPTKCVCGQTKYVINQNYVVTK